MIYTTYVALLYQCYIHLISSFYLQVISVRRCLEKFRFYASYHRYR